MKSGVYEIVNKVENKRYIGSTERDLRERHMSHFSILRRGKHHSYKLQRDWNKFGEEVFEFNVLHYIPSEYAKRLEQWYLDHHPGEYNISRSTEGRANFKLSKEECDGIIDDYLSEKYIQDELSEKYNCSTYTISRVISGRSYLKYKPDINKIEKCKKLAANRKRGDDFRKVSLEELGKIRYLAEIGMIPLIHIGNELGLYKNAVRNYKAKDFMGVAPVEDLDLLEKLKRKHNYTAIVKYDSSGREVGRFETFKQAGKSISMSLTTIEDYVKGKRNDPNGFIWKRIKI